MKLRWAACVLVMVGSLAVTLPVGAQGLNEVLNRLLSNGCQASAAQAPLRASAHPALRRAAARSATAGGTVGRGASAARSSARSSAACGSVRPPPAPTPVAWRRTSSGRSTIEYFDKDTTRFETGFDRDTVGGRSAPTTCFATGWSSGPPSATATSSAATTAAAASTTTPTGSWSTGASCRSPACSSTRWSATRGRTTASIDEPHSPRPG